VFRVVKKKKFQFVANETGYKKRKKFKSTLIEHTLQRKAIIFKAIERKILLIHKDFGFI
jgi:hypothetical protein